MKKEQKVTFNFERTGKRFSTVCTAKFDTPVIQCSTLKMYKNGVDSKVAVAIKEDTEINIVMPEYARSPETLETMCGLGQAFCSLCQFNALKSKQK